MPDAATGSVTMFFHQLQAGDQAAVQPLWQRYLPRLLGLARKTLAGQPSPVLEPDDAVQSAFVSFWQRARQGEFRIADRNDLWNLLGVITVRKARNQARRERADKRGGGRVVSEGVLTKPDGTPLPLEEAAAALPSADFDLHSEELLNRLDEELRTFAVLRLMGWTNREIADRLDCTERKVERKLNLIRLRWENECPSDD